MTSSHVVVPSTIKAQCENGCDPQFDELFVGKLPGLEGLEEADTFDDSHHVAWADEHGLFFELPDLQTQSVNEGGGRSVRGEVDLHVLLYLINIRKPHRLQSQALGRRYHQAHVVFGAVRNAFFERTVSGRVEFGSLCRFCRCNAKSLPRYPKIFGYQRKRLIKQILQPLRH